MAYDVNGNMIKDLDRNIFTIKYNILNLPEIIQFKDGHQIINAYDAGGQKLSSRYYTIQIRSEVPVINTLQVGQVLDLEYNMDIIDETGTFYIDNKEYSFNGCDPGVYGLNKVYNSEGYADYNAGYFVSLNYFRKDHIGNNREVWNATTNTTVQRTQFYPSGLPWNSTTGIGASVQNKKYNGKEWVEMHGYDMSDLGFRGLQNSIMRFTSMDALAELTPGISPYAFCFNNPVRYIDPLGLTGEDTSDKDMFGRNRHDPFTGMYIPPIDRQGGMGAYGFGDTRFGHWETNSKTFYHQNYIYNSQGELVYYGNVQGQTVWTSTFIWDSQEEKQYGKPAGQGGVHDWGRTGNPLVIGGMVYYGLEKCINNSKYWVDAKGNIRSTELLKQGVNGKYVRGVQGLRNSQSAAAKLASKFSVAGKVVGGLGMAVTATQYMTGQISGTEFTIDFIMGGIGLTVWGAPVSLIYFGGKLAYETISGNTLFEKPSGQ